MDENEEFLILKEFSDMLYAKELNLFLLENGIDSVIGDNIPSVDITFIGSRICNKYEVRINKNDYLKAKNLLENEAEENMDNVNEDYYLHDFSNNELFEILKKSDEWGEFDFVLAKKILASRGEIIDKSVLKKFKEERLKELSQPRNVQKFWIIIGYVVAFLVVPIGLVMGFSLWESKRKLPNGEKVYVYSHKTRSQGKNIFFISLVVAITIYLNIFFIFQ